MTSDGKVQAGHNSNYAYIATAANDLTTKKYVDAAGKSFTFKFKGYHHPDPGDH